MADITALEAMRAQDHLGDGAAVPWSWTWEEECSFNGERDVLNEHVLVFLHNPKFGTGMEHVHSAANENAEQIRSKFLGFRQFTPASKAVLKHSCLEVGICFLENP